MKPRIAAVAFTLGLAGCAVGPSYHPAPAVPPATRVGAGSRSDSARAFFDSLAAARAADSARPVPPALPPRALATDSIADLAWLDLLRDSALTRLVTTALRQNRDLALARARIREYRAAAGVARSPLFPSLALNGSTSTNKIALGSFAPVSYHAWRVTADVAWELDFWGGTRRGLQAAPAGPSAQGGGGRGGGLSPLGGVGGGEPPPPEAGPERGGGGATPPARGV